MEGAQDALTILNGGNRNSDTKIEWLASSRVECFRKDYQPRLGSQSLDVTLST